MTENITPVAIGTGGFFYSHKRQRPMEAKRLLEEAYERSLSEADFQAISCNLTAFFDILHEWKNEEENNNDKLFQNGS